MRRIQIYIDEATDDTLRQVAAVQGRSAASIIREAVHTYLTRDRTSASNDPFRAIIGAYEGGPDDAAEEHDRYLYGEELHRR